MTTSGNSLKVAIYGPGAVGLDFAYHLIRGGHDVTLIGSNRTVEGLSEKFLYNNSWDPEGDPGNFVEVKSAEYNLSNSFAGLDKQDLVFITTPSDALYSIDPGISGIIRTEGESRTKIVTATNGIPPWYFMGGIDNPLTLNPEALAAQCDNNFCRVIPYDQIIGVVVKRILIREGQNPLTCKRRVGKTQYIVGSPDFTDVDSESDAKAQELARILDKCDLSSQCQSSIRAQVAFKATFNGAVNTLNAITGKTPGEIVGTPELCQRLTDTVNALALLYRKIGAVPDSYDPLDRILEECRDEVPDLTTSMRRHLTDGKPLEIEGLIGVPLKLALAISEPKVARHLGGISTEIASLVAAQSVRVAEALDATVLELGDTRAGGFTLPSAISPDQTTASGNRHVEVPR